MSSHDRGPRFRRVAVPAFLEQIDPDGDPYALVLARDPDWMHQLPWFYRALASPWGREPIPLSPKAGGMSKKACAYWASLLHLLMFHLGWARPDRGLDWWYRAGRPTEDPILEFVDRVWGSTPQLDWFTAWLLSTRYQPELPPSLKEMVGYEDDHRPLAVDRAWVDRMLADASRAGSPFTKESDNLHLHGHVGSPVECVDEQASFVVGEREPGRAVLLMDSLRGWYATLAEQGGGLPSLGERSWRVEVIVRPIGHLGVFRRSRETGLWFACRHGTHVKGV